MRVTIKEKDGSIYEFESPTIDDVYKKMEHYFNEVRESSRCIIDLVDNKDGTESIIKTYKGTVYKK